ncbi:hypothetical protein [Microbulbifer variabilis]|uniref:hypothetical protein n=1 Tax=Microbulbifer variabilis TaxID=266805 RepID=UPI0003672045|nr:hypothetical protein [Microbulbifer variabilis]
MKKIFYMLVMTSIANLANADCSGTSCVGVYVDRLYVTSHGIVHVGTNGDEKLLDCDAESGVYATLDLNNYTGADAIFSTLLSAQMADKKVQIRITEGSAGCSVQYVTLDRQ